MYHDWAICSSVCRAGKKALHCVTIPGRRRARTHFMKPLAIIIAVTSSLGWLAFSAPQSRPSDIKPGVVQGTVFTVESDGGRSVVPGVKVRLGRSAFSIETISDDQGNFSLSDIAPGNYQIDVDAPEFTCSNAVTVLSGEVVQVPMELKIEERKDSVTVSATEEPVISRDVSGQTVIERKTVVNAPNQYDRFDNLLPLVPGVVRGPDGLINLKGARSSHSVALVNIANVTDQA